MLKLHKGYTLVEAMIVVAVVAIISIVGFGGYVAVHFINKFW